MKTALSCSIGNRLVPLEAKWCPGCLSSRWREPRPPIPERAQPPSAIRAFVSAGVPPSRTPAWEAWKSDCRRLGLHAPDTLVGVLGAGDVSQQYAALVCLRVHGFEAFGIGTPSIAEWKIRAPGSDTFQTIVPNDGQS